MASSLYARDEAIIALTPNETHADKEGYLVNISGDTAALSSSATVPARGVILEGNDTTKYPTGKSSVGILGALKGVIRMKAGGAITKGDRVMQNNDGTILTDSAAGARVLVGVALETGVATELIEVAPHVPLTMS